MNTSVSAATPEQILQRLDWQVIRKLDGQLQGDYRSLFHGFGVDFSDLREYQPQDDIRYIDWNVTARMDAPYVRQYMEDREVTAWFLLDLSPSVDFGTAASQALKRDALIDFTATLTRLLTRHGNRVGAMFFSDHVEQVLPARGGKLHTLRLIHELQRRVQYPRAGFTNLKILLDSALNFIKRRSLIFIISDFLSVPGWEKPLSLLSRRHEVLAIRVWDPREVELPDLGLMLMEDSETGEQMFVDTGDRKFRKRFEESSRRRAQSLQDTFKHAGVDLLSISTEADLVRTIVRFAEARRQRRRP
jgi:uncharacterized protein (DUF58 family)